MLKSIEQIGDEIKQMRDDRVRGIKEIIMKKYDLSDEQFKMAEDESYF